MTGRKPSVSVAMATYNGEPFLQEQLDSLARQTLLPLELVVGDDGSTDGTLDILRIFAAKAPFPVRVHRNEARLGYSLNFLRTACRCSGDLIAYCDQDDVWLAEKLAVCAAAFASDGVSMVIHLAMLVDGELEPLGRVTPYLNGSRKERLKLSTLPQMEVPGMVMVFRRCVAESLTHKSGAERAISEAFRGHDNAMRFLAGSYGSVVPVRKVLAFHRCHGANTSGRERTAMGDGPTYIFGERGARRRLLAVMEWLRTHAGLAWQAGARSYSREAIGAEEGAEALRKAASCAGEPAARSLRRASEVLSKRATALSERSLLYEGSAAEAPGRLFRMFFRGLYGSRLRGGLGISSLLKDSLLPFRRPRPRVAVE